MSGRSGTVSVRFPGFGEVGLCLAFLSVSWEIVKSILQQENRQRGCCEVLLVPGPRAEPRLWAQTGLGVGRPDCGMTLAGAAAPGATLPPGRRVQQGEHTEALSGLLAPVFLGVLSSACFEGHWECGVHGPCWDLETPAPLSFLHAPFDEEPAVSGGKSGVCVGAGAWFSGQKPQCVR